MYMVIASLIRDHTVGHAAKSVKAKKLLANFRLLIEISCSHRAADIGAIFQHIKAPVIDKKDDIVHCLIELMFQYDTLKYESKIKKHL